MLNPCNKFKCFKPPAKKNKKNEKTKKQKKIKYFSVLDLLGLKKERAFLTRNPKSYFFFFFFQLTQVENPLCDCNCGCWWWIKDSLKSFYLFLTLYPTRICPFYPGQVNPSRFLLNQGPKSFRANPNKSSNYGLCLG